MKHKYYVVYSAVINKTAVRRGSVFIGSERKIDTESAVLEVQEIVAKDKREEFSTNEVNVILESWALLDGEDK